MIKLENEGYCFISNNGIKYELLEGVSIGSKEMYTSDIIFIMLTNPNYNVDNNIVGYLFGVDAMKNNLKEYEESIKKMVTEFEKRNFKLNTFDKSKKNIGIINKAVVLNKLVGKRFYTLDEIKNEIEKNADIKVSCIMESESEKPDGTDFMIDIEFERFNIYTIFYLLDNDNRYYITEV